MGPVTISAIFLIVWWTVLFAVLPFGVRGQAEEDSVEPGTEPGAPVLDLMWKKVGITTAVAAVVTGLFVLAVNLEWFDWRDWPFLPELPEGYSD